MSDKVWNMPYSFLAEGGINSVQGEMETLMKMLLRLIIVLAVLCPSIVLAEYIQTTSVGNITYYLGSAQSFDNLQTCYIRKITYKNASDVKNYTFPARVSWVTEGSSSPKAPAVTKINSGVLANCTDMQTVTIGTSISTIGMPCFRGCTSLTDITIPGGCSSTSYCDASGVLFNGTKTILKKYPEGKVGASYTVPSTVTELTTYSMSNTKLTTVVFQGSAPSFGECAFADNTSLQGIGYPQGITGWPLLIDGVKTYAIPKTVQSVSAGQGTSNLGVTITWAENAVAASYKIYRASSSTGTKTLLATVSGTTLYTDISAESGTKYYYTVIACNGPFVSASSVAVQGWKKPETCSVTFDANGGGVRELDVPVHYVKKTVNHEIGKPLGRLPDAVRSGGYEFLGWFTESNGGVQISQATVVYADVTYYAHWQETEPVTYAISYNPGRDGNGSAVVEMKAHGVAQTLKGQTFARLGYVQTGWSTGDGGAKSYDLGASYAEDAPITLYPYWSVIEYSVTYDLSGGINDARNPSTYWIGSAEIRLMAPTKEGCEFKGWTPNGGIIPQGSVGDLMFTAHWENTVLPDGRYSELIGGYTWHYICKNGKVSIERPYDATYGHQCVVEPKPQGAVEIPETLGGCPVVKIGDYAFWNCYAGFTSVTIPETVTEIGDYAFAYCSDLRSVAIPNGVVKLGECAFIDCGELVDLSLPRSLVEIGDNALRACRKLPTVDIPNGVLSIGSLAFADCDALTLVRIPDSVTSIAEGFYGGAFADCQSLTNISVSEDNATFCSLDGVLYNKDRSKLLACPAGLPILDIPNGVVEIAANACAGCTKLKSVQIPESVRTIGRSAFEGCVGLSAIAIPCSVTSIGDRAFAGCYGHPDMQLKTFIVDKDNPVYSEIQGTICSKDGLKLIVHPAGLRQVVIPESVTEIGACAFCGCNWLLWVDIPNGVESIDEMAFADCDRLTTIRISQSVHMLGMSAFWQCQNLCSVFFEGDAPMAEGEWGPYDVYTYVYDGKSYVRKGTQGWDTDIPGMWRGCPIAYYDPEGPLPDGTYVEEVDGCIWRYRILDGAAEICEDGEYYGSTHLEIPPCLGGCPVAAIGPDAFASCETLASVSIPIGIVDIDYWAFGRCANITSVVVSSEFRLSDVFPLSWRSIVSVSIPEGVTSVCDYAFSGCENLETVVMPEGLLRIGLGALSDCEALRSVEIPATVDFIGDFAFGNDLQLTSVLFNGNAPFCDASMFLYAGSVTSYVHVASSGWNVEIPGVWNERRIDYVDKVAQPLVVPKNGSSFIDSCEVSITCDTKDAIIYYTTNGKTPRVTEANRYKGPFTISDTTTIVAVAVKGEKTSEYVESTITKVIPEPLTLVGVLDEPKLANVTTGGDAEWLPIDDAMAKVGGSCAVSGALDEDGEEESTWLEAKVYGKGTLTFWWRVSCEPDPRSGKFTYDFAAFEADDEVVVQKDGESDWVQVTKTFTTDGEHVIRWSYNTDGFPSDDYDGCVWVDGVTWSGAAAPEEPSKPTIEGDEGATVTGDAETGFVIKPSEGKTAVEVTIPQGVDAAKVTVEVSPKVASVKPNGAKVKIVSGGADITEFLDVPAADGNGVVDLTKATVKEEIVKEAMDVEKGAKIELDAADPKLKTAPTRVGLFYQLREGETLDGMKNGDSKVGDGEAWTPNITVKGGNSAFYSIGVGKGE